RGGCPRRPTSKSVTLAVEGCEAAPPPASEPCCLRTRGSPGRRPSTTRPSPLFGRAAEQGSAQWSDKSDPYRASMSEVSANARRRPRASYEKERLFCGDSRAKHSRNMGTVTRTGALKRSSRGFASRETGNVCAWGPARVPEGQVLNEKSRSDHQALQAR